MARFNYKRGAQRLYLVLSVFWIAAIVAISISDHWDSVTSTVPKSAQLIGHHSNGDAKIIGYDKDNNPIDSNGDIVPVDANGDVVRAPKKQSYDVNGNLLDDNNDIVKPDAPQSSTPRYWVIKSALIFTPPLAGYLILFGLLPWIGRGFRSTQL